MENDPPFKYFLGAMLIKHSPISAVMWYRSSRRYLS